MHIKTIVIRPFELLTVFAIIVYCIRVCKLTDVLTYRFVTCDVIVYIYVQFE